MGKLDLVKHLETERDALQQQRIVLFASKDPETEERRMEESVRELRSQLDLRREARNESRARLDGIMIRLHDLETVQATRRELLQREEIAFGKSLLAKGFRSEDDYLSACLPEEKRRTLQERMRELSRNHGQGRGNAQLGENLPVAGTVGSGHLDQGRIRHAYPNPGIDDT